MPEIIVPDQFIDVHFPSDPKYVFGDLGVARFRGAPIFEDSIDDILAENQWEEAIREVDGRPEGHLENLITMIFNQGQEGSCVSNATSQGHQVVQAFKYGKDKVTKLSAISLYQRVATSAGGGSMLSDNLEESNTRGIVPLDVPENARFAARMPATGFRAPKPNGWEIDAAKFKILEWFDIRSLAGLVTASVKGYPIIVGRDGHSILYVRPTWKSGKPNFIYPNSWGDWGFALAGFTSGFGLDSITQVNRSASWAFAIRDVSASIAA